LTTFGKGTAGALQAFLGISTRQAMALADFDLKVSAFHSI
jgi:hypothetical protein